MTLEQRKEQAAALHRRGYNCCQCVLAAYADRLPAGDAAIELAAGMGGGVGGQGHICGAVSALAMLRGAVEPTSPQTKAAVYADVRRLSDAFRDRNGSVTCRELRSRAEGVAHKPCDEYIADAIEIFDQYLQQCDA